MRRTTQIALASGVGLLAITGCSSKGPGATSAASTSTAAIDRSMCQDPSFAGSHASLCGTEAAPSPSVKTEGSVTTAAGSFIQYPDGLRAQVVAVRAKSDNGVHTDDQHPANLNDELVTVTMQLSNTGSNPVQLNTDELGPSQLDLYYGENRYDAEGWVTDPGGISLLPHQLVPGTNARFNQDFTMPSSGLSVLAVRVQPDSNYTPFVFTDVQTLIR